MRVGDISRFGRKLYSLPDVGSVFEYITDLNECQKQCIVNMNIGHIEEDEEP